MTLSRRKQVRRSFSSQAATATVIGADMIDLTVRNELSATADPEIHELTVTGTCQSTSQDAVYRITCYVTRGSTHPTDTDAKVRTRDLPANVSGLPFHVKFKALRMNPGDQLGIHSKVIIEQDSSATHRMTLTTKDVFTELG